MTDNEKMGLALVYYELKLKQAEDYAKAYSECMKELQESLEKGTINDLQFTILYWYISGIDTVLREENL